ncbi:unnamed protein product [Calicophoron daubneyi]|uniref:Mesencephalic astrocyte-derived neurotrophic factor homolog n=1 Tax=Calicophoron daubneyi TaxID=300641 RepID=A0AAV2TI44_CALDB
MSILWVSILFILVRLSLSKKVDENNCEVCVKYVRDFINSLPVEQRGSKNAVKEAFEKTCSKSKGKNNTFCYSVGGLEMSAAKTVDFLVTPVTKFMPAEKVCEELSSKVSDICDLTYEKQIDLKELDLKRAPLKVLRKIISDWGIECRGCAEKSDFVNMIEQNMPIYDPEAAAYRDRKKSEL